MKKLLVVLGLIISFSVSSQENFYFNYARCEITGVFNGELVKTETKNVKAGLDDFTHDFIMLVNFADFHLKNKITGENIVFDKYTMKIKGQIPLGDMRANNKQIQNYKAELDLIFPKQTITALFNIEVQFFAKTSNAFRIVRMRTEINADELENDKLKGFEKNLFIDVSFQIYKFKDY